MGRLTAQRKRRGRKPGTVVRELASYKAAVSCACMTIYKQPLHDDGVRGCARTHYGVLIRELRAALKGAKT